MRTVMVTIGTLLLAACAATPGSPSAGSPAVATSPAPSRTPAASASAVPSPSPTTPGAPIASDAATIEQRYTEAMPLFEYDEAQPLDVEVSEEPLEQKDWGARHEISYASPRGDRVTGLLGVPNGEGPFPAVIVMHGMPGAAEDLAQLVTDYPAAGVIALGIDAPFVRSRSVRPPEAAIRYPDETRQDQIDLIRDLRRAVDVLQARPDVDGERIGYQGFSYGGTVGGQLAGVEPRIAAFVLAVADGGLLGHLYDPADYARTLGTLTEEQRSAWIDAMEPIEPIYFVGRATAPILFQSARGDELIPVDAAERFHAAGPPGSEVEWYESGHFLPGEAFCDASAWLDGHLEFEGTLQGCD